MFKKLLIPFFLKSIFTFLIVGYTQTISAQNEFTISQFLSSINKSNQVYIDSSTTTMLSNKNYNLPLIKSAQFRLETRRFVETWQEYSLRVKPNSYRAISNQKYIYQNKLEEVKINNQIKINEELKRRYLLIIDYIFNNKLLKAYLERQQQLKDKLDVLSLNIYNTNFDVKDLIDTEEDLLTSNLRIIQLQKTRSNLILNLKQLLNSKRDNFKIIIDNFIVPDQIINISIPDSIPNKLLFISLRELKINTLEREMQLEVAKSKQILDYVQAKYIGKSDNLFEENLSLGLGVNIPFFGNARKEKSEFYFNKLNKENELIELEEEHNIKVKLIKNEFDSAILNYQTFSNQNRESAVSLVLESYKKMEGASPLLLLKLKIIQNKKELEILKFQKELYKSYIDYLSITEILFQQPFINYLSNSRELLSY